MTLQLKIIQGKPRGTELRFPQGQYVFGRGPECHLRSNSDLVSRQHCLLQVGEAEATLRDLGSSNGTLINGKRLREPRILQHGDTLQLGLLVLRVVLAPSAPLPLEGGTLRDGNLELPAAVSAPDTVETALSR